MIIIFFLPIISLDEICLYPRLGRNNATDIIMMMGIRARDMLLFDFLTISELARDAHNIIIIGTYL